MAIEKTIAVMWQAKSVSFWKRTLLLEDDGFVVSAENSDPGKLYTSIHGINLFKQNGTKLASRVVDHGVQALINVALR